MSTQKRNMRGHRAFSVMLPSDVITIVEELLQSIPQQRQAEAEQIL